MICANCETETAQTPCVGCGDDSLLAGKYQLERILGRGAQGTTFLATGPDGICAVKELQLGRATGGKATELFHREAAVLDQLSHDNIPELYDHFVDGVGVARSLYVVQQFISGTNLEERLNTHRFTEEEVRGILGQLAEILEYLHSLSPPVIHRDIKPSNLILDDDGQLHLVDFGAVRDVMRDSVGGGSTVAGTFGYMAPEQLVGDATPQSDLYALGMTAIRLLTRQHPTALADRMGNMEWRSQANVSEPFAAWIDSLIQVDPTARPTHGQIPQITSIRNVLSRERLNADATPNQQDPPLRRAVVRSENRRRLNLTEWALGFRRTNSSIDVGRRMDSRDRQAIATIVGRKLQLREPMHFAKSVSPDPEEQQFHLTAVKQGITPLGFFGASLDVQVKTKGGMSRIHMRQLHADGWIPAALGIIIPVFLWIMALSIGLGVDEMNHQQNIALVSIFTVGVATTIPITAAIGWVFCNWVAAQYKSRTAQFVEAIVGQFNNKPSTIAESRDFETTLPMEEHHPEPVAFDMSEPRPKTRN